MNWEESIYVSIYHITIHGHPNREQNARKQKQQQKKKPFPLLILIILSNTYKCVSGKNYQIRKKIILLTSAFCSSLHTSFSFFASLSLQSWHLLSERHLAGYSTSEVRRRRKEQNPNANHLESCFIWFWFFLHQFLICFFAIEVII